MMNSTRSSLLLRVRDLHDSAAWDEFYALYAPLVYAYARARGLQHEDCEDIRATCLSHLVKQLPTFEYDRTQGGFKAWLRTLVQRRIVDLQRGRQAVPVDGAYWAAVPDEHAPDASWEQAWRDHHLARGFEKVRTRVEPQTFAIFQMMLNDECTVADVCERLQLRANQVYKARTRVLAMLREELALLDPDLLV